MDFQFFVDSVNMPCCVMSVEKTHGGGPGEIRIVCANKAYIEMMGPSYYDGMIYSELVPQDNKFEDFCYRAAVLGQRMHAYVETQALNCWTDQTIIPLQSDRKDLGYCQFIFEFTQMGEADRMAKVNHSVSETVIEACIKLMGTSDFKTSIGEALDVMLSASGAKGGRIMLVDHEAKKAVVFCDRKDEDFWAGRIPPSKEDIITYDLICSWEALIGVSNALLIKDENDMEDIAKQNPSWAASMRQNGVTNLVMVPLRREKSIVGYLYLVDFDEEKVVEVKEMTELMAFFLTSEVVNYLLMNQLDRISKIDALTGLGNRRAMIDHMHAISNSCKPIPYGIVNIDLNGLKYANDHFGHEAGDRLLLQASEIMRKVFYQEDLYRTGGDEFVIIAERIDPDAFERKVTRLRNDMLKNADVSFAIGSCLSDGTLDISEAFRKADEIMYADKKEYYKNHPEKKR